MAALRAIENKIKPQVPSDAHFGDSHYCGYCGWANRLHTGCVVNDNARAIDNSLGTHSQQQRTISKITFSWPLASTF